MFDQACHNRLKAKSVRFLQTTDWGKKLVHMMLTPLLPLLVLQPYQATQFDQCIYACQKLTRTPKQ